MKKQNPRLIVAGNVRKLMTINGVSGQALATRVGLSSSSLSKRLNGNVPFVTDELFQIANVFKVDVTSLFL